MDTSLTSASKTASNTFNEKGIYSLGYVLLAISFLAFVLVDYFIGRREGSDFGFFFLHYFIAIGYTVVLLSKGSLGVRKSWRKENINKTSILLNLFLISAYALNRELPVFEDSSDWLCVFLIVSSITTLSFRFFNSLSGILNAIQYVIIGSTLLIYLYLTFYVANFYTIGSIGILGIGIGAHIFVPIFILINIVALIKQTYRESKASVYWVLIGSLFTVGIVTAYVITWNARVRAIEKMANQSVLNEQQDLPVWVKVGQTIPNDWMTERILKSKLVYTVFNNHFQWDLFPLGANWDEARKHDPLVFISSSFGTCTLPDETRVKILKSISDNRHRAQERLWSGDNLVTSYIVTDVDIYPDLRLAYTEKYLNIRNTSTRKGWWGATEEAIYTFQLPEGSVVTSLSLWINGKEEKSVLTSKQKATVAYTTIVGKERRDPSVLHWQEGNTISVRVFPCTQNEERKFKIGITSPLPEMGGELLYKNITFKGPSPTNAKEATRIRFITSPENLTLSSAFEKTKKGEYFQERGFDPDLTITFKAVPLKSNRFSFDGYSYSLVPYSPEFQSVKFDMVFLDINNSWNKDELDALQSYLLSREAFVYDDGEFLKLNGENWNEVTSDLLKQNFSLFPFHLVKDAEHSVVVSKGKELSPHLQDFKESEFASRIGKYFAKNKKIKLFNLEGGVSTYISSFRELRGLEFAEGDVTHLTQWLKKSQFPKTEETDEKIILHDARMMIVKSKTDSLLKDNAPDHLARLFAYNDILRKVGANYFNDDFINDELVDEAATAYVVSPVSSLIVLETKEDYDRFGIADKDKSLHNASKQSSGAVPEPHEWALILIFVGLILFTLFKNYRSKFSLQ